MLEGRTQAVISSAETPTADFTRQRDWRLPDAQTTPARHSRRRCDAFHRCQTFGHPADGRCALREHPAPRLRLATWHDSGVAGGARHFRPSNSAAPPSTPTAPPSCGDDGLVNPEKLAKSWRPRPAWPLPEASEPRRPDRASRRPPDGLSGRCTRQPLSRSAERCPPARRRHPDPARGGAICPPAGAEGRI